MDILIIKSASIFFDSAIQAIKKKHPESILHLLKTTDPKQMRTIEDVDLPVDKVWELNSDNFSYPENKQAISDLQSENFDMCYILHRTDISNYINVYNLAAEIGLKKIVFLDSNFKEQKANLIYRIISRISNLITKYGGGIKNWMTNFIVYSLIIVLYVILSPYKLFKFLRKKILPLNGQPGKN